MELDEQRLHRLLVQIAVSLYHINRSQTSIAKVLAYMDVPKKNAEPADKAMEEVVERIGMSTDSIGDLLDELKKIAGDG